MLDVIGNEIEINSTVLVGTSGNNLTLGTVEKFCPKMVKVRLHRYEVYRAPDQLLVLMDVKLK